MDYPRKHAGNAARQAAYGTPSAIQFA